ncbi:Fc receptor-like protein 5 isoform X2 [Carettochelys insculpta]|uniref:Fc receptor-like protein 5 isoform X2 n=1 Tax=Carettochelys insculpta TaxID=44489 RepID=UPI003EB75E89
MALNLLLPVLACLQIFPWPETIAGDASPMPLLSVNPKYSSYLMGDSVTFTCSVPKGHQATQLQFLKDGDEVASKQTQSQHPQTYHLPSLNVRSSGSYRCRYLAAGQKAPSQLSDPVTINVHEKPPPTSLSLDPPCAKYLVGEQLMLSCIDPKFGEVTGYRFYNRRNMEVSTYDPDPHGGAKHVFLSLHMDDAGPYTCKYWTAMRGQEILSVESEAVSVSVLEPPSQPALSMDPPSGVIKEGLPLLITCSAPRHTGEWRFRFYKNGVELVPENTRTPLNTMDPGISSVNVSVLSIPRARPDSTGEFTCSRQRFPDSVPSGGCFLLLHQ